MRAQLDAVFDDIGVDAAKTGMLFSRALIETVADYLREHAVPLVVDPVMVASSGAKLLEDDAVDALVGDLFPLATVVTPNLLEARALTGSDAPPRELAERLHELGAPAVIVTGGHGDEPVDHLFDGQRAPRDSRRAARRRSDARSRLHALRRRSRHCSRGARASSRLREGAAAAASRAVAQGLTEIGAGDGPVDILGVRAR